jgi:hypothetical protein
MKHNGLQCTLLHQNGCVGMVVHCQTSRLKLQVVRLSGLTLSM